MDLVVWIAIGLSVALAALRIGPRAMRVAEPVNFAVSLAASIVGGSIAKVIAPTSMSLSAGFSLAFALATLAVPRLLYGADPV